MDKMISAPLPASEKRALDFRCKLCGHHIRESATQTDRQFMSRLQHMKAKHLLPIHEFFKPFFDYLGGAKEDMEKPT